MQASMDLLGYLGIPLVYGSQERDTFSLYQTCSTQSSQHGKPSPYPLTVVSSWFSMCCPVFPYTQHQSGLCQSQFPLRLRDWRNTSREQEFHLLLSSTMSIGLLFACLNRRWTAEVNDTASIKIGWQTSTANSILSLWFKVRYFKKNSICCSQNPIHGLSIWKNMRLLAPYIHRGSKWVFGNGQDIDIWFDSWCADHPISDKFSQLNLTSNQRLSSFFQNGSWVIPPLCPMRFKFCFTKPPLTSSQMQHWKSSSDGFVTLKAEWSHIRYSLIKADWANLIWSSISTRRISCFRLRLIL